MGLRILTIGLPNRKAQEEPKMSVVDRQLGPLRPGIGGNGSGIKAPKALQGSPGIGTVISCTVCGRLMAEHLFKAF